MLFEKQLCKNSPFCPLPLTLIFFVSTNIYDNYNVNPISITIILGKSDQPAHL